MRKELEGERRREETGERAGERRQRRGDGRGRMCVEVRQGHFGVLQSHL